MPSFEELIKKGKEIGMPPPSSKYISAAQQKSNLWVMALKKGWKTKEQVLKEIKVLGYPITNELKQLLYKKETKKETPNIVHDMMYRGGVAMPKQKGKSLWEVLKETGKEIAVTGIQLGKQALVSRLKPKPVTITHQEITPPAVSSMQLPPTEEKRAGFDTTMLVKYAPFALGGVMLVMLMRRK